MEQSIQTASFIYGLISLVTLIVFFVMANNVSQIKKSLTREEPGGELTDLHLIIYIIAIIVFSGLLFQNNC